uniref:Uncharacterized protein n=1 Tax=Fagus sylvatica TaxID=28930 RepID=A0A2N9FDI1_FAGSY
MASSSKAQAETPGGSPMDKENPATTEAPPLVVSKEVDSDTQSDSNPISAGSGPLEGILAHPTLDPWYEGGSLFPSISANAQLPPAGWEWLVKGEDATADAIWVPPFQEILDLKIQRKDILAVPLKLPILGDCDPSEIELSPVELKAFIAGAILEKEADSIGGGNRLSCNRWG